MPWVFTKAGVQADRCPFCGTGANLTGVSVGIRDRMQATKEPEMMAVKCLRCGARGPDQDNWGDAIHSWNSAYRRLTPASIDELADPASWHSQPRDE